MKSGDVPAATARLVLLGASNLTMGLAEVIAIARGTLGGPLDVLAAPGHGRSYGERSRILGRTLGGIEECGLWAALREREPLPVFALLTDIGNDVAYGYEVAHIAGWVELAVGRIREHAGDRGVRAVITAPPVESLRRTPAWRFAVAGAVLFPFRSVPRRETLRRIEELDRRLEAIAAARGCALVRQPPDWYGIDPIHYRWRRRREAWRTVLEPWRGEEGVAGVARAAVEPLRGLAPERKWLFGIERRRRQPCVRLADGTAVSLY